MAEKRKAQPGFFGASTQALEFGQHYAVVLARWGALFAAASALIQANVELGRFANESAEEFDAWVRQTAAAPWSWLDPSLLGQMLKNMTPPGTPPPTA